MDPTSIKIHINPSTEPNTNPQKLWEDKTLKKIMENLCSYKK